MKRLFSLHINYQSRVYGLDVFRALAIISVVMGHGGFMIDPALPGFPWIRLIDGVELFFVLSGFLIGAMLMRQLEQRESFGPGDLFRFWMRRWFRTIPNYYLVLLLNILFVSAGIIHGNIDQPLWKFFLFVQNFSTPFVDFFWESWSLTVEEWFYLLFPFALFVLAFFLRKYMAARYIILGTVIAFILLPLVYRIQKSDMQVDPFWFDVNFRKLVVTRLDAIMYGVLFAWFQRHLPTLFTKIAIPGFVAGFFLTYFWMHLQASDPTGWFSKTLYFSFTGISVALMLPLATRFRRCKTRFGRAVTHISVVSYSMYLINLGLISQVIEIHFKPSTAGAGIATYIAFWTLVIGLSTLLYKYFEKPVMDVRDRI